MRAPYTQLYVHMIWSTWDRLPLITEEIKPRLYASIAVKCRELNCEPLAISGIVDHIHLLVRLHAAIAVSVLAKEVKGSSSHLVTHEMTKGVFFKWQGGYRAFTLRKSEASQVKVYIENQQQHHVGGQLQIEWEPVEQDDENADE